MSPRDGDPLGLRPEPSSTGPKTGRAPAPGVGAAAGSGNLDGPSRFGQPALRSTDRIVSTDDRRAERKEAQVASDATREELYKRAQELDIEGRSDMNKDELATAVAKAEASE